MSTCAVNPESARTCATSQRTAPLPFLHIRCQCLPAGGVFGFLLACCSSMNRSVSRATLFILVYCVSQEHGLSALSTSTATHDSTYSEKCCDTLTVARGSDARLFQQRSAAAPLAGGAGTPSSHPAAPGTSLGRPSSTCTARAATTAASRRGRCLARKQTAEHRPNARAGLQADALRSSSWRTSEKSIHTG